MFNPAGGFATTKTLDFFIDNSLYNTTTCETNQNIVLPDTPPEKPGYNFAGWRAIKYTPVEYLENSGTQYIDTGFKPNQNSGIDIDFFSNRTQGSIIGSVCDTANQYAYTFGIQANSTVSTTDMLIYTSKNTSRYQNYWRIENLYNNGNGRYQVQINGRTASVLASNNTTLTHTFPSDTYQIPFSLYLFASNRGTNAIISPETKIYSCKLYDNNTLVHDFIPVLDEKNIPCMYDKITHSFFYNAGTGDFIAGPTI